MDGGIKKSDRAAPRGQDKKELPPKSSLLRAGDGNLKCRGRGSSSWRQKAHRQLLEGYGRNSENRKGGPVPSGRGRNSSKIRFQEQRVKKSRNRKRYGKGTDKRSKASEKNGASSARRRLSTRKHGWRREIISTEKAVGGLGPYVFWKGQKASSRTDGKRTQAEMPIRGKKLAPFSKRSRTGLRKIIGHWRGTIQKGLLIADEVSYPPTDPKVAIRGKDLPTASEGERH